MTRKELYEFIQSNKLSKVVKDSLGCNYTNAKTSALEDWFNNYNSFISSVNDIQECDKDISIKKDVCSCNSNDSENIYKSAIVTMLANLSQEEVDDIVNSANNIRNIVNNINCNS